MQDKELSGRCHLLPPKPGGFFWLHNMCSWGEKEVTSPRAEVNLGTAPPFHHCSALPTARARDWKVQDPGEHSIAPGTVVVSYTSVSFM